MNELSYLRIFLPFQIIFLRSISRSDIANVKDMYMFKTLVNTSPRKEVHIYIPCSSKTFSIYFNEHFMLHLKDFPLICFLLYIYYIRYFYLKQFEKFPHSIFPCDIQRNKTRLKKCLECFRISKKNYDSKVVIFFSKKYS